MTVTNEIFAQKAEHLKKPLKHKKVLPEKIVTVESDDKAFQKLKTVDIGDASFPITLKSGDSVILDFGDHNVGYLNFSLNHDNHSIADSPVKFKFTFGEFPLEIETLPEDYSGWLGSGWLQNDEKTVVFTPASVRLERRYSFRYLKIERIDNADFIVSFTEIYADCVSAVDIEDAIKFNIPDERLKRIYNMSLKTLKECEQHVFEDGPKRDRRLWIGDLRLQAICDYVTFNNIDLIKRCIYLFAAYRVDNGRVAPCIFPDSPPYVSGWYFVDYSLFFVSCLYDYVVNCKDYELLEELYSVALEQINKISFNKEKGEIDGNPFIDWCENLDKSVAIIGVYIYTLKQFCELTESLGKDANSFRKEVEDAIIILKSFYSEQEGLFKTKSGQLSWHSQIWAVLSGALSNEESIKLLENTECINPEFTIHTPYMMHYYIEALYNCGLKDKAILKIKEFWGKIADFGFDCCPEIFNPSNHFESPYSAPEINSACHAWSCTPLYWIYKYYND